MNTRYAAILLLSFAAGGDVAYAQGDSCTTAVPITSSGTYYADGPSSGQGYVNCGGAAATSADWYSYTATFTGAIEIRSCGGGQDTRFSVLMGSCGALICLAEVDDNCELTPGGAPFASEITVGVTAGTTYFIQWDDRWSNAPFTWELSECFGSVQGVTYRDQNLNGLHDAGEFVEPAVLEVNPGGLHYLSTGDPYSFCSDSGSYTITVPNPPLYHNTLPASQSYTVSTLGSLVAGMDFAFQPIPGIYDGTVSIWGWNAWIGNNSSLHITYCNEGTEVIDGSVVLTLDSDQVFVSSVPAASSVVGQLITWTFTGLLPGDCASIDLVVHTDSTVMAGQAITNCVDLFIDQSDIHGYDNHDCLTGNATTSMDPNEKLVDRDAITLAEVAMGSKLEYTIHFQNTGTAPAVNIVVKDSIDADLDITTFEMVDATHPYTLQVSDEVAIWTFNGIMLPDSTTDEANSHGGIHFRIAPRATSGIGTVLSNRADIYFDYNAPVLTNTVLTQVIESATGIDEVAGTRDLVVYPSPSTGAVLLVWNRPSVADAGIEVIDATGRVVVAMDHQGLITRQPFTLDLSALNAGTYTVHVIASGLQARTSLVIE